MRRQKTSALKHFSFCSEKWTAWWNHVLSPIHENYFVFKSLSCNTEIIIFNKESSLRAIFKSILHVSQNVCHGERLLIHVTVYDSAFFWVTSWTLNYILKT